MTSNSILTLTMTQYQTMTIKDGPTVIRNMEMTGKLDKSPHKQAGSCRSLAGYHESRFPHGG